MSLHLDAPLALLEADVLSDDSSNRGQYLPNGVAQHTRSNISLQTEQSDLDLLCSGSLTDLVLNFDDRVHHCLDETLEPLTNGTVAISTNAAVKPPSHTATLSDVKFWWKEAAEEQKTVDYPFGAAPEKLGAYEEFEAADADGVTEDDNLALPVIRPHKASDDEGVADPDSSFQGHVTTDSECSSFSNRGLTPEHLENRSLSPCLESAEKPISTDATIDPPLTHMALPTELQSAINTLLVSNCLPHLPKDLTQFPVDGLQTLKDALFAAVLRLSDRLVELLAMRDELTMLREASDDFIILLDLVHQRRTRASRAALLLTARGRVRRKGFARANLPWITKSFFGTPSSSLSSLSGRHSINTPPRFPPPAPPSFLSKDADSVDLNASSGSVSYYKSLNLQSKNRRPRTQPLVVRQRVDANTRSVSPSPRSETEKHPSGLSNGSTDRSHDRLVALRKLCHTLAWPNDQPQMSKVLSLCLPYDPHPVGGVNLPMLRRLNQILHGALLENPSVDKLVRAYIESINGRQHVVSWIQDVSNHMHPASHLPLE